MRPHEHTPAATPPPRAPRLPVRVVFPPGAASANTRAASPRPLAHPPTRPPRPRRWVRPVAFGILVLGSIAGALGLIAMRWARERPLWWSPVDPADERAVATARTLENGIVTLLTKMRSGKGAAETTTPATNQFWTVALKADDANAWLATRLKLWVENEVGGGGSFRWPAAIEAVQVRFEGGAITVAASVARPGAEPSAEAAPGAVSGSSDAQILSATIHPDFRADGSFWLPARWVSVGRLGVPAGWMLDAAAAGSAAAASDSPNDLMNLPQTRSVLSVFAGGIPVMRTPILKIGDGRRVRLVSLDAREGRLFITCETVNENAAR